MNVSNAIMPKVHSASTANSARNDRDALAAAPAVLITRGTSRTASPRSSGTPWRSGSSISRWMATRSITLSATATTTGPSSGSSPGNGAVATSTEDPTAPTAIASPRTTPAVDRPRSRSASGSAACDRSTNHASSGPDSSAR